MQNMPRLPLILVEFSHMSKTIMYTNSDHSALRLVYTIGIRHILLLTESSNNKNYTEILSQTHISMALIDFVTLNDKNNPMEEVLIGGLYGKSSYF